MSTPCIIDHVAFEAPVGLHDSTRYVFGDDTLFVELEAPPGGATPAAEALAGLRRSITSVFPSGQVLDEGDTVLDGRRARFLAYEVGAEGRGEGAVVGMAVVANLIDGDYVKLGLHATALAELGPRFGPILGSVSLTGGEAPVSMGPGARRERVGPIALDVPNELLGPRSRLYTDTEDRLRLRVSVRPVGSDAMALEDAIASDSSVAELLDREERAWPWGWWVRYRRRGIDPPHHERTIVRAGLSLRGSDAADGAPDGAGSPEPRVRPRVRQVEIQGTAEPDRAAALYGAFDALLASMRWYETQDSRGGEARS